MSIFIIPGPHVPPRADRGRQMFQVRLPSGTRYRVLFDDDQPAAVYVRSAGMRRGSERALWASGYHRKALAGRALELVNYVIDPAKAFAAGAYVEDVRMIERRVASEQAALVARRQIDAEKAIAKERERYRVALIERAAPELLTACKLALDAIVAGGPARRTEMAIAALHLAIAKAEGVMRPERTQEIMEEQREQMFAVGGEDGL